MLCDSKSNFVELTLLYIFFVLVFSYKEKRLEQDAPTSDDFAF